MPGTITTDLINLDLAEVVTNWLTLGTFAGGAGPALNDDPKIQGGNCIDARVSANSAWSLASITTDKVDFFSGGKHLFHWQRNDAVGATDSLASGGQGISISSDVTPTLTGSSPLNGPTNSKTWFLNGFDGVLTGGWFCYVVNPNGTPDLALGSATVASIRRAGVRWKVLSTISNKSKNTLWDAIRVGTSLTAINGTDAAPVTMADIYGTDSLNANAWGIVTQYSGAYFGAGKIQLGSSNQTAITRFKDSNQTLIWRDFPVANDFYAIRVSGAAGFTSEAQFGTFAGGLAAGGWTVKGAGKTALASHAVWTLNCLNENGIFKGYASTFSEMRRATLSSSSELRGSVFQNFGDITPNKALIDQCIFQDVKTGSPIYGSYALVLTSSTETTGRITNSKFLNCNRAIRITQPGTYQFNNLQFDGNAYDIENASLGSVTINVINTDALPPTTFINVGAGSHTKIENPKVLQLTGLEIGSEVRVYNQATEQELAGDESVGTDTFTYEFTPTGITAYVMIVHLGYEVIRLNNIALDQDRSIPVQQRRDRQYLNPP